MSRKYVDPQETALQQSKHKQPPFPLPLRPKQQLRGKLEGVLAPSSQCGVRCYVTRPRLTLRLSSQRKAATKCIRRVYIFLANRVSLGMRLNNWPLYHVTY